MDKLKLIILAIAISVPVCSSLIWALMSKLRVGGPVGSGIIILFIILAVISIIFPTILVLAVYKCNEPATRNMVWGVMITLYMILPVYVAISEVRRLYRWHVIDEAREKLRDINISYEGMIAALSRAGYQDIYPLTYMLSQNRIDFAKRYMCENPKADHENLPDIMVWYYYTNEICDDDGNYSDSLSMQAAVITAFLLDNGWDINATGTKKHNGRGGGSIERTALYLAILNRDSYTANLLIERGTNVNTGRYSCLWMAILEHDVKRVQMLVERGANPNEDYHDKSLLCIAVKENNTEIVKILLDSGAKPRSGELLLPLVDKQTNPELWELLSQEYK